MEQGACLGTPGITAHRAVHVGGDVRGGTVLVQGAAGAVRICAVALARHAGARVIGTVRSTSDEAAARGAGAQEVVLSDQHLVRYVKELAPEGIDHIVVRKQNGFIWVQDFGGFGHEQHIAEDHHVRGSCRGLLGKLQAIPDIVRQILHFRVLVVVREDHCVPSAL